MNKDGWSPSIVVVILIGTILILGLVMVVYNYVMKSTLTFSFKQLQFFMTSSVLLCILASHLIKVARLDQ